MSAAIGAGLGWAGGEIGRTLAANLQAVGSLLGDLGFGTPVGMPCSFP